MENISGPREMSKDVVSDGGAVETPNEIVISRIITERIIVQNTRQAAELISLLRRGGQEVPGTLVSSPVEEPLELPKGAVRRAPDVNEDPESKTE